MMWGYYDGWSWLWMAAMMVLFWGGIIALAVVVIRALSNARGSDQATDVHGGRRPVGLAWLAAVLMAAGNACGTSSVPVATTTASPSQAGALPSIAPVGGLNFALAGRLVFTNRNTNGSRSVFIAQADGKRAVQITAGGNDRRPALTPDGRIAFERDAIGYNQPAQVYLIRSDGSGLTRLTSCGAASGSPVWSPDDSKLAFTTNRDGDGTIYLMSPDGTHQVRLTAPASTSAPRVEEWAPAWSPDGSWIAFTRAVRAQAEVGQVYVIRPNGSGERRLFASVEGVRGPQWSPDGKMLAATSGDIVEDHKIFVTNLDGTGVLQVARQVKAAGGPVWSPDGKMIAFTGGADLFHPEIYVVNADGSGLRQLTHSGAYHAELLWVTDSAHLIFVGEESGQREVYVASVDGRYFGQLTALAGANDQPSYSPSIRPPMATNQFVPTTGSPAGQGWCGALR